MYHRNETDETLVLLTLAGEQSAYEALVVRYQKAAVASAMAITKSHFMAEDAAQDAFVTAWMKLNTLRDAGKYGQWVCRIAKNCALNMLTRYRSFLPLDAVDNLNLADDRQLNPAELYALSEERKQISQSVEGLPEKVRKIIHLHYFEGLSIAEIADQMRISEGTVKWQLHDGRKRIRKELCAMNEKYTDTLVQRVMKKVEELKLWQLKNDKSGFETVYKDVLRDVEELPECQDKQHALADVLARGWWWLPGEKNDALFARIAQAAIAGKNEEVMEFIVRREDFQAYGDDKIPFIRDKQIPRLEKAGFVKTLAREWFWLAYYYFRKGMTEEGHAAYDKVEEILDRGDAYAILVPYMRKMEERLAGHYKKISENRYCISPGAEEYRYINGSLRYWSDEFMGEGRLYTTEVQASRVFMNSARCDGQFFADIPLGESVVGSDGTVLTYAADSETVDTPAGSFAGCQLWVTKRWEEHLGKVVYKSYYKDGVGIVKHAYTVNGITEENLLSAYTVRGGEGLLPFAEGNTWEYAFGHNSETIAYRRKFTVAFADGKRVVLAAWGETERLGYDENLWQDMMQKVCHEYWQKIKGEYRLCDVMPVLKRAGELAVTPMEKAHTKAAASVTKRILSTDPTTCPDCTATGHWNFFEIGAVRRTKETIRMYKDSMWHVEWKNPVGDTAGEPLYYNDILGILQDAANCIWSEEWRVGAAPLVEYAKWDYSIKTQITCEDGGTVITKAGTFENCLKVSLEIAGMTDGLGYRSGSKNYYFAEGVGIVRTENSCNGGARIAVYELTSYEGTADGYMPVADGLVRRYEAVDLTDGYEGAAEYTYVADEDGDIVIFEDKTGIRRKLPAVTAYSSVAGEDLEERLWERGDREDARLRHDVNNFHLLCHFLGRPSRYWCAQEKAAAWNQYRIGIMESLGENGEVPQAWLGLYASTCFRAGCALFACGRKEEGYQHLEKAFAVFPRWDSIPEGTEMAVGDPLIYGDIRIIKGKPVIKLPDGTLEAIAYEQLFTDDSGLLYFGMTATSGWEWFNSVRKEERFKAYIDRAKALTEKEK